MLSLSKFILIPILTEWLSIRDLVYVDAACSRRDKYNLLSFYTDYSNLFATLQPNEETGVTLGMIKWKLDRKMYQWHHSVLFTEQFLASVRTQVIAQSFFSMLITDPTAVSPRTTLQHGLQGIKSIKVDVCSSFNNATLIELLKMCSSLEEIYIGFIRDLDGIVSAIANNCPLLRKFTTESVLNISDRVLQLLLTKCLLLTVVNCATFSQPRSIEYLQECSRLQVLTTSNTSQLEFRNPRDFVPIDELSLFSFVLYRGSGLLHLDLSNQKGYSSECYLYIGQHCPNLRALFLPMSAFVDEIVLMSVCAKLTYLTAFGATFAYERNAVILTKLSVCCPNITELKLRYAFMMGGLFPKLQCLSFFTSMSTVDLRPVLTGSPQLTSLDATLVSREILECLKEINMVKSLRRLKIFSGYVHPSEGVEDITFSLPCLHEFDIEIPMSGSVAIALLMDCPCLQILKIEAGNAFQYHEFLTFANLCCNLRELQIVSENTFLDASVMTEIVLRGKKLRRLWITAYELDTRTASALQLSLEKLNPRARIVIGKLHPF